MDERTQSLWNKVKASPISDDAKAKIEVLCKDDSKDFVNIKEQVILMVADELNSGLDEEGAEPQNSEDPEVKKVLTAYDQEAAKITAELQENMRLVDDSFAQLASDVDAAQISAVKGSLEE